MSEQITPTGRVHWAGTGLSTGSGLGIVCDLASRTVLWGRTRQKAEDCLARLGHSGRAETRAFDPDALAAELVAGDIVVSMLPAAHHAALLRLCLERGAHFAASSYVSAEISALAAEAAQAGIVVLTEAGLDPGIDHLLAHRLIAQARAATGDGGASATFTSYCGSNPAEPNEFRYRFSWAPRGVLTALLTPARYVDRGAERVVDRPWEAVREHTLGGERFEVYPNRDSVPFVEQYGLPASWRLDTFVRGTIRLDGWSDAWAPVFTELREGDDERIGALARRLALRYPTTETDHDRVLLSVALDVRADDGSAWSGEYVLDVEGDEKERATPRLVSVALACGIGDILDGLTPSGLHRAAEEPEAVRRWLSFLESHGVVCEFRDPRHG
ncbi:hypothetical protein GCM10022252_10070 [Streptosporangium oxazolinicum]|uniref:Saccharopine dehydrogenase n=1 Tax=Streptosporangium oxazolinicum TaxID=909287 RepID=A0ABP8AFF5_9ACTN